MTEDQNGHQFHEVVDANNRPVPQSADVEQSPQQRANAMADAQEQANATQEMEFAARVDPVVTELQNRIRDLANEGDEAGVGHTRYALDVVIQRFRVPGDASASTADNEAQSSQEPPQQAEEIESQEDTDPIDRDDSTAREEPVEHEDGEEQ